MLELSPSEPGLFLVTGANGSGKSTLARELAQRVAGAQLLSAESQQAFYEAQLANDEGNFQQGVDTSSKVGELLGARAREHALFSKFRLAPLWERGYRQLSTGEGRKTLLLRAVLERPSLLVLDEPFDGLDAASVAELTQAIEETAKLLPVLVVGAFERSPFAAVSQVFVIERYRVAFRGSSQAWRARAAQVHTRREPPVNLGRFYDPLDPHVPLVVLKGGRVSYGEQPVFEGLDFSVMPGQHTLIVGPNGCGKSTLLEMITGDHPQAYSNDLHLFGRRRGSGETVWDIKKNVGIVSSKMHRDYRVGGSVEDVLLSGLFDSIGVYVRPEPSHHQKARAWLDWLELGVEPSSAFRELSFGQQRLVLIARAAIKVPPLVVMDEPTTGLDAENRERALELVESLCTQHKSTVLFVTHREDERRFWQERIHGALLDLGHREVLG